MHARAANVPELWRGQTYRQANDHDCEGAAAFVDGEAVGLFYHWKSGRRPIEVRAGNPLPHDPFTALIPPELRRMCEQLALPWLTRWSERGATSPENSARYCRYTTAIWSESGRLRAAEPWSVAYEHGVGVMWSELAPWEKKYEGFWGDMDLTDAGIDLVWRLYARRRANLEEPVCMSDDEVEIVVRDGKRERLDNLLRDQLRWQKYYVRDDFFPRDLTRAVRLGQLSIEVLYRSFPAELIEAAMAEIEEEFTLVPTRGLLAQVNIVLPGYPAGRFDGLW